MYSRTATTEERDDEPILEVSGLVTQFETYRGTVEALGGLDVAFANAGVATRGGPAPEYDTDAWDELMDVNLRGVFLTARAAAAHMRDHGGGRIVNTASIAGLRGFRNLSPYVASKHGVIGLTKTAALEFSRDGVRVNAVCPGVIETPMVARAQEENPEAMEATVAATPADRLGQPAEIAAAATWLCSDDASFVTGESLVVDGGFTVG